METINGLVNDLEKKCSQCDLNSLREAVLKIKELKKIDKKNQNIIRFQKSVEQNLYTLSDAMRKWLIKNRKALVDNDLENISPGLFSTLLRQCDNLVFESINQIDDLNFGLLWLLPMYASHDVPSDIHSFILNVSAMCRKSNAPATQFDKQQPKELSSEQPKELSSEQPKELSTGPAK
jgi:hypothetical protein